MPHYFSGIYYVCVYYRQFILYIASKRDNFFSPKKYCGNSALTNRLCMAGQGGGGVVVVVVVVYFSLEWNFKFNIEMRLSSHSHDIRQLASQPEIQIG